MIIDYRKIVALISLFFISISCCKLWGDQKLGSNLSVIDGDRKEDRIIVYCSNYEFGCCHGGSYVLPTYERHMLDGKYNEYVEIAKSNDKWIIAKTFQIDKIRITIGSLIKYLMLN